jgi:hypothetical protein
VKVVQLEPAADPVAQAHGIHPSQTGYGAIEK